MWQHPSPVTESTAARGLVSASTQNLALISLLFRNRDAPKGHMDRAMDRRRADEAGPILHVIQPLDPRRVVADAGSIRVSLKVSP